MGPSFEIQSHKFKMEVLVMKENLPERILTPEELAAYLGVTENTLAIWRHREKGPRFIPASKRAVRYSQRDVIEWIERISVDTQESLDTAA